MLEGCTPFPVEFSDRYIKDGIWRSETITRALVDAASGRLDTVAVADPFRSLTWSQLLDETAAIAAVLVRNGIKPTDRIVVQLPNCVEFVTFTLACFETGALPVMALPAFRMAELEYLVSFSDAKALAIAPEYRNFDHAALALELKRQLPGLKLVLSTAPAPGCVPMRSEGAARSPIGSSSADPFEVALFLLSGGTTGLPKLIPRTHADYLYNARVSAAVSGLSPDSRILIALPVEHNFPLGCPGMLGAMLTGAQVFFCQSTKAVDLAAVIERERITYLPCVPTIALALLELPDSSRGQLRSLRVIAVGGQRLQEPTARALKLALPQVTVQQVFGMAEGLLCFTRLDDDDVVSFSTQGRPVSPADEIRVVNVDGDDAAIGDVGELQCRGPYTLRGYFRALERNAEAFTADGFYRTGDLVRRHPSGNLVVEGRIKDLINRGGEKISAEEIESHLVAHPAISAAAVVAMPDPMLGEKACAYLTLRDGAALALPAMRDYLASRGVAQFKWPERIEVVDALPLTNVGKVMKTELRRDIAAKLAAERTTSAPGAGPHGGR